MLGGGLQGGLEDQVLDYPTDHLLQLLNLSRLDAGGLPGGPVASHQSPEAEHRDEGDRANQPGAERGRDHEDPEQRRPAVEALQELRRAQPAEELAQTLHMTSRLDGPTWQEKHQRCAYPNATPGAHLWLVHALAYELLPLGRPGG